MGRGRDRGPASIGDPALGEDVEREFWLEVFRAPMEELGDAMRIEIRRYGPIHALSIATMPQSPMFNRILGAAEVGASDKEHLAGAVEWFEEIGVAHRVPITPGLPGSLVAEDWLNRNGYERETGLIRFARDTSPPEFYAPPELEVDDFADYGPETEGFGYYATEAYELDPAAHLIFDQLPGRPGWGCYAAIDSREVGIGTATIWMRGEVAQLGFAATREQARGKGAHMALLRRRIDEAAAAGCQVIYAETEELLNDRGGPSAACVNLVRAGFKQVCTRPVWRSPDLDEDLMTI